MTGWYTMWPRSMHCAIAPSIACFSQLPSMFPNENASHAPSWQHKTSVVLAEARLKGRSPLLVDGSCSRGHQGSKAWAPMGCAGS